MPHKKSKMKIFLGAFFTAWVIITVILYFCILHKMGNIAPDTLFLIIIISCGNAFFISIILLVVMLFKDKRDKVPEVQQQSCGNQGTYSSNPYVDMTQYDKGIQMPIVHYNNIVLYPGEKLIFAVPAQTFIQKEQVVGYTGGSSGASIRVAKGLTVRKGSSRGIPIRQNVTKFNEGDYIVTTSRLIFLSQNECFEFNIEKVSACKIIAQDSFMIVQGSKQKNICVNIDQAKYAAGFTRWAIEEYHKNK